MVADAVEHRDVDPHQFATKAGVAGVEFLLAIDGHGVGDETPAGSQCQPAGVEQRPIADIAAEEIGAG